MMVSAAERMQIGGFVGDDLAGDGACDVFDDRDVQRQQVDLIAAVLRYIRLPPDGCHRIALLE